MTARDNPLEYAAEAGSPALLPRARVVAVTAVRGSLLGLWFLAGLVLARTLGKSALGLYTLAVAAIRLVTDCASDPLDLAVMREVPLRLRDDRPAAISLVRSAFWLRIAPGVASVALVAAVPWLVSRLVFDAPQHRTLAILTCLGILGDLLLRSCLGYLQASEHFGPFLLVDSLWQISRALAAIALAVVHQLSATTAIGLYVASPYLAFILAMLLLPRDIRRPAPPAMHRLIELLHYGKWMAAAMVLGAIYERLDIFLLNFFHGSAAVGIYGGALMLAMIPDSMNGIVQTAVAPRIAPAHASGNFRKLQEQYLITALPIGAAVAAIVWPAGGWIVRIMLGKSFAAAAVPFKLLVMGTLFNLCVTPLATALLSYVAPRRVALISMVGLVVVACGGLAVIPRYGASGAAAVILAVRLLVGGMTLWMVNRVQRAGSGGNATLNIEHSTLNTQRSTGR